MISNNYQNIPDELKLLPQWVCFDISEEGAKLPYTPGTDKSAASNRPKEWRSFRMALKDVEDGKRQHIGFCFSSTDPFVFLDLDDPDDEDQVKAFKRFQTYSQRSVGGSGVHLIMKGRFTGPGRHPKSPKAGLFQENRFCLMTGDVVSNRTQIARIPDEDIQAIHTWLSKSSKDYVEVDLEEAEQDIPDLTIIEMGCDTYHKFSDLCSGRWQKFEEYNNDHSAADHAFVAMLADLTDSNSQVRRLFGWSGMWTAERAAKKAAHGLTGYVDRTLRKIRGHQETSRAMTERIRIRPEKVEEVREEDPEPEIVAETDHTLIESLPEGLVKEIARYSYRTSFYPLQEASLLVSLTLISGIAGRAFLTPTMAGLNMWSILVGGTSCGKDEYQSGISRILGSLEKRGLKSVARLYGGELVSGPALEQVFLDRKRYIAYFPEFGDAFRSLANPMAPEHLRTLSRALLNSFKAADLHGSIKGRRKAQGVEGVESIDRPCLVLAGECTPESLYGAMGARELSTGFLQRFLLLNVPAASWSMDENPDAMRTPPKSLLDRLEQLVILCDGMEVENRKGKDYIVVDGEEDVLEYLKQHRRKKRMEIRDCPEGLAKKEAINRSGLKILRLASALAIGADIHRPIIRREHAEWAIKFVERTDSELLSRFTTGEIGSGQPKQEAEIRKAAASIREASPKARRKLGMDRKMSEDAPMIPLSVLKERVIHSAAFASDRSGAVTAFERAVESMVKAGEMVKVEKDYAFNTFGYRGVLLCYP